MHKKNNNNKMQKIKKIFLGIFYHLEKMNANTKNKNVQENTKM